ncbi:nitrate reductase [Acidisphaera sp. L21]|uniref:nitrate reductase n=1 Tax=Acidisphaera sp. L21 TaxID=1641851 RepID=UPI00131C2254|nr:nitrate reductase [Acidisphaera sp. L21]
MTDAPAVRTTCPYCGVGCGVLARPTGPEFAEIAGDPVHPANFGRLCVKGTALGETLSLQNRLLYPEIAGARASWDDALGLVAAKFRDTIAEHGPDSVALYVSGQLLTEDYYAANKLAKGFLGTANIDSNSRLCMSSAVAGHRRAFGEDIVPTVYEDLELADLLVLVGSNTAWCHPVLFQRIAAARATRPTMRVVVIDPRRTATCEGADMHLAIAPGTDVALFAGLLRYLHRSGRADRTYAAHLEDVDDALAAGRTVADVAAICGLRQSEITKFYELFASTAKTVTMFSQGVNQSSAGVDKVNAIINVHLLTGRIGKPGAGPFSITGQPNAMGGREVGALSNLLAAHLEFGRASDLALLRDFWSAPNLATNPGLKAVSLFEAVAAGKVRALWVIGTNPAVSLPNGDMARAALAKAEFLAISDCANTDSGMSAHVRLPAQAWGEKDGTVTNSERVISRQRSFLSPPGEARPDWWIIAQVAARLGHGAAFAWRNAAEIFREHATLSGTQNDGSRLFDISALARLNDAEYEAMKPARWPRPAKSIALSRLFGRGGFPTPSGRARMVPTPYRAPANPVSVEWPLVLITGRLRDQWHTMTRTGKTARLFRHIPEPVLAIHPDDMPAMEDGDLAVVESPWGSGTLRVRHDRGLRRGTVFAPMHWTAEFCAGGRVNSAVNPAVDPLSGQPEFKHTPVQVRPAAMDWHGFALTRRLLGSKAAEWCAVIPLEGQVWRHELAGHGDAADAHAATVASLGGPDGWMSLRDPAAGIFRAAQVQDGRLAACVFTGRNHLLPARDWLMELFAHESIEIADRRALLAGRRADGAAPEPSICVCMGVGAGAIRAAIAAGCDSVAAVGKATTAGTNCGSCRPEIGAILTEMRVKEPA